MLKLWKWSTGVFVLQALVGGTTYYLIGNLESASWLVALVTFIAFWAVAIIETRRSYIKLYFTTHVGAATALAAMFAAVATALVMAGLIWAVVCIPLVGMYSWSAQNEARKAYDVGPEDPWFFCFLTALPLGIGTTLGGLLLLMRPKQNASA